jgi:hypothetical protein
MEKKGKQAVIKFIDNPHAPVVFAEEAVGFFMLNGNLHITLASPRVDHTQEPGPINKVVMARLVMPIGNAHALAIGIYDFLKKRGIDPSAPPDSEKVQ